MAEYGIVGADYGMDLPQSKVEEQDLTLERNAAKFSKTKEYKQLKTYLEARIDYYKTHLPDGRPVLTVPTAELVQAWTIANAIISEFNAVISAYETAEEAVRDATQRTRA